MLQVPVKRSEIIQSVFAYCFTFYGIYISAGIIFFWKTNAFNLETFRDLSNNEVEDLPQEIFSNLAKLKIL